MGPVLVDGAEGDAPRPHDVDLLAAEPLPDPPPRPGSRRHWIGTAVAVVLAGLLGGLVGAGVQQEGTDRRAARTADDTVALTLVDLSLDWTSFRPGTVVVALRNTGPRAVTITSLHSPGGGLIGRDLPLPVAAGDVGFVAMGFGSTCEPGPQRRLVAGVTTRSGGTHQVQLDVVGDEEEEAFVAESVSQVCGRDRDLPSGSAVG
ncbi:hypothetical protein [Motilibacter rhizosphaerae]|uniref:hypothetical protein n=1 Tax=Motilibacter rhizosphaerae TaxID=598652 RepID=UPI00102D09EF|nr:hypothetical protein [Motilibacter rhizosphaerae]